MAASNQNALLQTYSSNEKSQASRGQTNVINTPDGNPHPLDLLLNNSLESGSLYNPTPKGIYMNENIKKTNSGRTTPVRF